MAIAPNPASGPVLIHARAAGLLQLHDARGQLLLQQRIPSGTATLAAHLAPGVYLLRLEGAAGAQRLVVE